MYTIIYDLYRGKLGLLYVLRIAVTVFGAFIIKYDNINSGSIAGFLISQ